jgi:hypothetical protein
MADRRPEKTDATNTLLGEVQAALWLSESLILALLEANLLDVDTILEAIDIVIAARKTKVAEGCEPEMARAAITQLASISASIAATKGAAANPGKVKRNGRTRQKPSTRE